MNNNEIFLNLYNSLDDLLKKKYNMSSVGRSAISRRIHELQGSPLMKNKERAEKLDIIRNLRNSLVHVEKINNEENFIISSTLIDILKNEIDAVEKPLSAIKICVPIKEVLCASLIDNVMNLSNKMFEYGFTHVPILINGYLFGVFSQNTIFSYFVDNNGIIISQDKIINDFASLLPINKHNSESFMFVASDEKVDDLVPLFNKKKKGKRLVMLFVTQNGKEDEKILGIITSYDLLCENKEN